MQNNLIGRFYFKRTTNGNLIGEFSNNTSQSNSSESADLKSSFEGFDGVYNSTWQEDDKPCFARLTIKLKEAKIRQIFSLIWKDGDKIIYWGEGILCDGILMGDYRNFEKISWLKDYLLALLSGTGQIVDGIREVLAEVENK